MTVQILTGDCREALAGMAPESVHCCITSPPYWGLRDYGTAKWEGGDVGCDHVERQARQDQDRETPGGKGGSFRGGNIQFKDVCPCGARRVDSQLGLEPTFQLYVEHMVEVFREVRRVLRKDGTLWLNLGDSYASQGGTGQGRHWDGREKNTETQTLRRQLTETLKPKDLVGIPWRVAFALQADGWYLRQDIIWSKPNPMPESVRDRCTRAHEYIFLLSRSERYYYDAEAVLEQFTSPPKTPGGFQPLKAIGPQDRGGNSQWERYRTADESQPNPNGRNRRSVWEVATAPFSAAHFATFPPALIEPCVLAGCPEKCCAKCGAPVIRQTETEYRHCDAGTIPGVVLDPFFGAGTTGLVADRLQRHCIGIELNPTYAEMARRRIHADAPLFAEVGP